MSHNPSSLSPVPDEAPIRHALAAHHVYTTAGRLLGTPEAGLFEEMTAGEFFSDLTLAASSLDDAPGVEEAAVLLERAFRNSGIAGDGDLSGRFQTVFGHALSPDFPPYETQYGSSAQPFRQSQQLADVAGFYAAFGLQLSRAARDRHDHLAIELEFLGFLALKEAHALQTGDAGNADVCRAARRKFLDEHLGPAIRAFNALLQRGCPDGFYKASARLADAAVCWEHGQFGVGPNLPESKDDESH